MQWSCDTCFSPNPAHAAVCDSCGSHPPPGWAPPPAAPPEAPPVPVTHAPQGSAQRPPPARRPSVASTLKAGSSGRSSQDAAERLAAALGDRGHSSASLHTPVTWTRSRDQRSSVARPPSPPMVPDEAAAVDMDSIASSSTSSSPFLDRTVTPPVLPTGGGGGPAAAATRRRSLSLAAPVVPSSAYTSKRAKPVARPGPRPQDPEDVWARLYQRAQRMKDPTPLPVPRPPASPRARDPRGGAPFWERLSQPRSPPTRPKSKAPRRPATRSPSTASPAWQQYSMPTVSYAIKRGLAEDDRRSREVAAALERQHGRDRRGTKPMSDEAFKRLYLEGVAKLRQRKALAEAKERERQERRDREAEERRLEEEYRQVAQYLGDRQGGPEDLPPIHPEIHAPAPYDEVYIDPHLGQHAYTRHQAEGPPPGREVDSLSRVVEPVVLVRRPSAGLRPPSPRWAEARDRPEIKPPNFARPPPPAGRGLASSEVAVPQLGPNSGAASKAVGLPPSTAPRVAVQRQPIPIRATDHSRLHPTLDFPRGPDCPRPAPAAAPPWTQVAVVVRRPSAPQRSWLQAADAHLAPPHRPPGPSPLSKATNAGPVSRQPAAIPSTGLPVTRRVSPPPPTPPPPPPPLSRELSPHSFTLSTFSTSTDASPLANPPPRPPLPSLAPAPPCLLAALPPPARGLLQLPARVYPAHPARPVVYPAVRVSPSTLQAHADDVVFRPFPPRPDRMVSHGIREVVDLTSGATDTRARVQVVEHSLSVAAQSMHISGSRLQAPPAPPPRLVPSAYTALPPDRWQSRTVDLTAPDPAPANHGSHLQPSLARLQSASTVSSHQSSQTALASLPTPVLPRQVSGAHHWHGSSSSAASSAALSRSTLAAHSPSSSSSGAGGRWGCGVCFADNDAWAARCEGCGSQGPRGSAG